MAEILCSRPYISVQAGVSRLSLEYLGSSSEHLFSLHTLSSSLFTLSCSAFTSPILQMTKPRLRKVGFAHSLFRQVPVEH